MKETKTSLLEPTNVEEFNKFKELPTTHEDNIRLMEEKVLAQTIPWEGYHRANLIREKEQELIRGYDKKTPEERVAIFQREGETYAELFLDLLVKINKEETLQYLLTLIDQIIKDFPESTNLFLNLSHKNPSYPFEPFVRLLNRNNLDWYTNAKASLILGSLVSKSYNVPEETIKFFCHWLRDNMKKTDEKDVCNAIAAAMKLVFNEKYRVPFAQEDTLGSLAGLLRAKSKNFQLLYQILYCLWLLSYDQRVAYQISETKVIPSIIEIFRISLNLREKVTRMAVATLRNLLDIATNNEQMITYGIVKPLEQATNKSWADDEIKADLEMLNQRLEKNIALLSSFDVYRQEVMSGNLTWSPVHRSEKFWKENVSHFEDDNHRLLLVLKELLSTSSSPTVLAVAAFDLGEFARFHPRGKIIIQQLGLKIPLMGLMEDKDNEVRKNALLAVQKLMVTNWEYLTAENLTAAKQ